MRLCSMQQEIKPLGFDPLSQLILDTKKKSFIPNVSCSYEWATISFYELQNNYLSAKNYFKKKFIYDSTAQQDVGILLHVIDRLLYHDNQHLRTELLNMWNHCAFNHSLMLFKGPHEIEFMKMIWFAKFHLIEYPDSDFAVKFDQLEKALYYNKLLQIGPTKVLPDEQPRRLKNSQCVKQQCYFKYKSYNSLFNHINKKHKSNETFFCDWCDQSFKRVSNLIYHFRDDHNLFYLCSCNNIFKENDQFQDHTQICEYGEKNQRMPQGKIITCACAKKYCDSYHGVRGHLRSWHKQGNKYECPYCSFYSESLIKVVTHIKKCLEEKN